MSTHGSFSWVRLSSISDVLCGPLMSCSDLYLSPWLRTSVDSQGFDTPTPIEIMVTQRGGYPRPWASLAPLERHEKNVVNKGVARHRMAKQTWGKDTQENTITQRTLRAKQERGEVNTCPVRKLRSLNKAPIPLRMTRPVNKARP